jgi:triphosphoribosyl-dephospho-CoA synthetase
MMKSAAIVTIKQPGALTKQGRIDLARWLRKQASNLLRYGQMYVDKGSFQARYTYLER